MKNQQLTGHRLLRVVAVMVLTGLLSINSVSAMEPKEMVGKEVYTLTNLHPDEQNQRLYSTNYQLPGKIKVCTKVKIEKLKKKKMIFTIAESGREYEYLLHKKSTPEGFSENIKLYYGPERPATEIETLSDIDQEAIQQSRAIQRISRRGIMIPLGYPPIHDTPQLDYD